MKRHHQETNSVGQAESRRTSSLVNLVQLVVCYSHSPWRRGGIREKYESCWSSRRNICHVTYPRISYYLNNCRWKETSCCVSSGSEETGFLQIHLLCARSPMPPPHGHPSSRLHGDGKCCQLWDRSEQQPLRGFCKGDPPRSM